LRFHQRKHRLHRHCGIKGGTAFTEHHKARFNGQRMPRCDHMALRRLGGGGEGRNGQAKAKKVTDHGSGLGFSRSIARPSGEP
jgi:hypothetical protein